MFAMLLKVSLIVMGIIRISKCEGFTLPPLPRLPDAIEKLFKTTVSPLHITEFDTEQHNQSSGLPYPSVGHFSHGVSSPRETSESQRYHGRVHHLSHEHMDSERMSHAHTDHPFSNHHAHMTAGRPLTNSTKRPGNDEDTHNHDGREHSMHRLSTTNPFQEIDAAEMETSFQWNLTERFYNSETDGKNADHSRGTILHICEVLLLVSMIAAYLFAISSTA